jgi:drug/metabolite transporter (DMT)-like permease
VSTATVPSDAERLDPPVISPRLIVALGLVYLIWSSTYLALRVMVHDAPPFATGGLRYLLAGVILLAFQRLRGAPMPTARNWLAALPLGVLFFAVGNGLVAWSLAPSHGIGSGVAAVVCGTTPLWAGVLGPVFGVRASRREWLGVALGFAGVLVLGLGGDLRSDPLASALLVLGPAGWAAGSLWARRLPLAEGGMGAATQMVAGGAVMLAIAPLVGERIPETVSTGAILAFGYLVVLGSLVAFSAYHYVLAHARPALSVSHAYVNPVLALILGAALGGEPLGVEVIAATVLIVGAVLLLVRRD